MKKIIVLLLMLFTISAYSQNFYGSFESWRNYSVVTAPSVTLQSPAGWHAADSLVFYAKAVYPSAVFAQQVFKTTDAHSGSFAAKLITLKEDIFGTLPALLTNADIELDMSTVTPGTSLPGIKLVGGTPVTTRIPAMSAWVKYSPIGNDTAGIYVLAMKAGIGAGGADSLIGKGQAIMYSNISTYTKMDIPITYVNASMVPDFIQVIITPGSMTNPQDSSTLYVDDITVETTGIITPETGYYKIYPNPATNLLHIDGDVYKIDILNALGQQVYSSVAQHMVNIATLASGIYYLQLSDKNGSIIKAEKLIKQ